MSHSRSARQYDQEQRRRADEAAQLKAADDKAARDYAGRIVALWNARAARGRPPAFFPTIGTALVAGRPLLRFLCPACRQVGAVDLRRFDQHPDASISSLIPKLSCSRCCPNPPFARLLELSATP